MTAVDVNRFRYGFTVDPPRCPECGSVFADHRCAMAGGNPR